MGSLGPYARPNLRRGELPSFLSLARGGTGYGLSAVLIFGTPSLVVQGSGAVEGQGAYSGVPQAVLSAGATLEDRGEPFGSPVAVLSAEATALGGGEPLAAPQTVLGASGVALGAGLYLADGGSIAGAAGAVAGASTFTADGLTLRPTLLDKLGPKIAGLRATLALKIGDRPYRVYLVTARWSGGEPGLGSAARTRVEVGCGVDRKTGLVQPPKIEASSPLKRPKYSAGKRGLTPAAGETDVIYLTQVDPQLVERDFVGFADLERDQEAYFEIEHVGARGGVGGERPVRRYRLAEAPAFDAVRMQWVIALRPVEPGKSFGGPRLG